MYLLNGKENDEIAISDRGLQYGDGLFETIEVLEGKPVFLNQHLQRLTQGCQRLLIPCPDIDLLIQESYQLSSHYSHAVLKLTVTRGSGGRGYRQPEIIQATRLVAIHPYPDYPVNFAMQGITARFCHTQLGLNPQLAGIKHLNRLEQVLARAEWNTDEFQEGLMCDINGLVIEGTMSNLFLVKNNRLYTPSLKQTGIKGIIREIIIQIAEQLRIPLIEKHISQTELYSADALFVTNSVIGIWSIKQLEHQHYLKSALIEQLQTFLSRYKQND